MSVSRNYASVSRNYAMVAWAERPVVITGWGTTPAKAMKKVAKEVDKFMKGHEGEEYLMLSLTGQYDDEVQDYYVTAVVSSTVYALGQ